MAEDQSQTLKAVLGLKGMIVDGKLRPGARVSELYLVDQLGVSRTPARMALSRLQQEGLLKALPSGGFIVSEFTETDVFEAIEVRGTLEGLAARYAAERGVMPSLLAQLQKCVTDLDEVVRPLEGIDLPRYAELNDRFHELLAECGQSAMVKRSIACVVTLPFAAPRAFVSSARSEMPGIRATLITGQDQHRSIVEAIQNREGARAQALAIEHARTSWNYLRIVLDTQDPIPQVPCVSLVRRRTG